jgi:hypothetical protein
MFSNTIRPSLLCRRCVSGVQVFRVMGQGSSTYGRNNEGETRAAPIMSLFFTNHDGSGQRRQGQAGGGVVSCLMIDGGGGPSGGERRWSVVPAGGS